MKRQIKTIINKEKSLKHIQLCGGNISAACRNGCFSRTQIYEWLKIDECYRNKFIDVFARIQKFSECKLLGKATQGDTKALIALAKMSTKQLLLMSSVSEKNIYTRNF